MKKKSRKASNHDGQEGEKSDDIRSSYVHRLNKLEEIGFNNWIEKGKQVIEFCAKAEKLGFKGDLYVHLANHPDALCGAMQYRNFARCATLFHEFGGDSKAPKLPMTHYIQVLNKNLGMGEKRKLLRAAEDDKLSVRELQKLVTTSTGEENEAAPKKSWEWTVKYLAASTLRTFELASWLLNIRQTQTVPDEVRDKLTVLVQLLIAEKLVAWDELKAESTAPKEAA
jgi:hypothetical protein